MYGAIVDGLPFSKTFKADLVKGDIVEKHIAVNTAHGDPQYRRVIIRCFRYEFEIDVSPVCPDLHAITQHRLEGRHSVEDDHVNCSCTTWCIGARLQAQSVLVLVLSLSKRLRQDDRAAVPGRVTDQDVSGIFTFRDIVLRVLQHGLGTSTVADKELPRCLIERVLEAAVTDLLFTIRWRSRPRLIDGSI